MALLMAAAPVGAHHDPIRLSQPKVGPATATVGDPISFEVRYRNLTGAAPDAVWVDVAGHEYPMQGGEGPWADGVRFAVVISDLPVGRHRAIFHATSGDDAAKLSGRRLTVKAAPASSGTGSGTGEEGSGAGPGSATDQGSGGAGTPSDEPGSVAPGGGTGSDAGGSGSSGGAGGSSDGSPASPSDSGSGSGAGAGTGGSGTVSGTTHGSATGGQSHGGATSGGSHVGSAGGASAGGGSGENPGTADTGPSGASDRSAAGSASSEGSTSLDSLGFEDEAVIGDPPGPPSGAGVEGTSSLLSYGRGAIRPWPKEIASASLPIELSGPDIPPYVRVLSVTVTTTGAVVMTFAFGFFAKRRRDGDPTDPDEVLEARSARAGSFATATLVPAVGAAGIDGGPSWPTPQSDDPEGHLPRWRRPSLQEARKADPSRSEQVHVAMTFTGGPTAARSAVVSVAGGVAAVDGLERRRIRYRLVRLLDGPDELRAGEIGYLDEGDEVQLVAQAGAYWLVHCANGQQGWIHRMTLGDIVESDGLGHPAASAPSNDELDGDVLAAFLGRRAAN